MVDQAINLIPEATDKIDLTPELATSIAPDALDRRSDKADYALGPDSPGKDYIVQSFWMGHEQRLRENTVLQEQVKQHQERNQMIADISRQAAAEGRSLSDAEQGLIYGINRQSYSDGNPNTILEKLYAQRFISEVDPSAREDAEEENPDLTAQIAAQGEDYMTKQQIAQKIAEDIQSKINWGNWGEVGLSFAKGLVPFWTWANIHSKFEGVNADAFFAGQNMEQQMRGLYFLPQEEFGDKLQQAVEEIAKTNLLDAAYFANAAVSYSTSDAVWDNVFTGLDILDVATLGVGGAAATFSRTGRYASKIKSAVKAAADFRATKVDRLAAQGDIKAAAEAKVVSRLDEVSNVVDTGGTLVEKRLDELAQGPGVFDPENFVRNSGVLSNERAARMLEEISTDSQLLSEVNTKLPTIPRVFTQEALDAAYLRAEKVFRRTNNKLEDAIIDVTPVRESDEVFGGVDRIDIFLGTKDATSFTSPNKAKFFADNMYRLPEGSYDIVNRDGNWLIRTSQHVDETDLTISTLRIGTDHNFAETFQNRFLGYLRNPDTIVPQNNRDIRKAATYGTNAVMKRLAEVAKPIGALGKNESERLRSIMDQARFKFREVIDPATGEKVKVQGKFYQTSAELEQAYLRTFNTMPSEKEIRAYTAFRQIMDAEWKLMNVSVWRDLARQGVEQVSFNVSILDEAGKARYRSTPFFNGRVVDNLPEFSRDPFTVMWVDPKSGKPRFSLSERLGDYRYSKDRASLQEALDSGNYKIVQVADIKNRALKEIARSGGEDVNYVVVKDMKKKPLATIQVPYNEGGHWNYSQSGVFMKQPKSHRTMYGRRIYDGSITAHWFPSTDQANKFLNAYEIGRGLLKDALNGNAQALNHLKVHVMNNLPYDDYKQFARLFRVGKNSDRPFSLNAPFVLTQSGQDVTDVMDLRSIWGDQFVNSVQSEHNLMAKVSQPYMQERNMRLTSINETGTPQNPVYSLTGAPLMDSMQSVQRSAARMAKSRFFDDLKASSIEDWAAQFADLIDAPREQILADPLRYLKEFQVRKGANPVRVGAAKDGRRAILSILNVETDDTMTVRWFKQKVLDTVYKTHGDKTVQQVEPWLWNARTDPLAIVRTLVHHTKLGMLAPVQFPLQAMATMHAFAIDGNPIRCARAGMAYWFMRARGLTGINPRASSLLTKKTAKALGMDEDIMEEMYDAWTKSGVSLIEGEYTTLDDALNPRMFISKSTGRKALDFGQLFFREGNSVHRGTSFALAYLEWRDANPLAKLSNKSLREIVSRTDDMYINMTRASNAAWQNPRGNIWEKATSSLTQFFSFHARLNEQLLALGDHKILTGAEKARVLTMYSTLYGIPVAAGAVVGVGYPAYESLRQAALENGYNPDTADVISKVAMEGVSQLTTQYILGESFDISDRLGPGGLSWATDLMRGDLFEALGASPNFVNDTFAIMHPFWAAAVSVFDGNPETNITVTPNDFVDASKIISTASYAARALYIYNTGEWLTSKEQPTAVFEKGNWAATLATAAGLTPTDVADTYIKMQSNMDTEAAHKEISGLALVQFRRGIKAAVNGDRDLAQVFFTNAKSLMVGAGMTDLERANVWKRAMDQNRPLLESVNEEFWLNDPEKRMPEEYR